MTVSGEVLRRHVSDLHDVNLVATPHPTIDRLDILRLTAGTSPVTLASAVAGFKWNMTGTLVLGGHVSSHRQLLINVRHLIHGARFNVSK